VDFPVQNITTDRQENADLEAYIRDFLIICGSKLITYDCPGAIKSLALPSRKLEPMAAKLSLEISVAAEC
jgi:hypothetical protein